MNFLTNVSIVVLAGVLTNQAIAGQSMTVQGRLLNSDGTALTSSAVQFNVQIRSSGVEDCLLYEESQTLNLSTTQGAFAITVGQGTRSAASVDGGNPLNSIFSNSKTISLSAANSPCANADTSYTPTATDNRILVLTYDDGSGWDSIPAIPLSWVPQAMYAQDSEKLSGVDGSQYLKVAPGVTASALSSNDYTKLTSLVAGTNSSYVQTANLPVCGAGEFISAAAGGVLSCQSVSGASGGTVTNVTSANSYLTVTTGTSTPSLTLNVGTAANTVAAGNDSRITNALQSGAAAGGDLSGNYPNPTITNGAVTATKLGSDVGLWSVSGSDVYRAGGNVGIGTATPLSVLQVNGTMRLKDPTLTTTRDFISSVDTSGVFHLSDSVSGDLLYGNANTTGGLTIPVKLKAIGGIFGETHMYQGTYFDPVAGTASSVKISGNANGVNPTAAFTAGVNGASGANLNTYGAYFNNASTVSGTGLNYGIYAVGGNNYFSGNVGIGTSTPASRLHLGSAPTASANFGLVSLGSGPFDGTSAGFFNGNVNGTLIGANTANGFTGDFANFQIAGVTKFKIDSSGNITANGTTSSAGNISTTGNITTTGTGTITSNGVMYAASGAASTSPSTGAFVVSGGLGVSGDQYLGGSFNMSGSSAHTQNFSGTATNAASISANNLTSGSILDLSSASTASTNGQTGLNIFISGANVNSGVTRYGVQSSVTSTGTTSTNIGASFSASGATNNYGLLVPSGNVGIGTPEPRSPLEVTGPLQLTRSGNTGWTTTLTSDTNGDLVLSKNVHLGTGQTIYNGASVATYYSLNSYRHTAQTWFTANANQSGFLYQMNGDWTPNLPGYTSNISSISGGINSAIAATFVGQAITVNDNSTAIANTINGLLVDVSGGGNTASTRYSAIFKGGNVGVGTSAPGEALQVEGNMRVGKAPSPLTTLSGAALAGDTSILVGSTAGYPSSGTLQIDSEAMTYTGVTATSFTGLTRGVFGTTAAGHLTGKSVYAYLFAVQGSSTNPAFYVLSNNAVAIGSYNATNSLLGSNSLSVGTGVRATGAGSFALGNSSTIASGGGSIAAGNFAQATGSGAVATGFHPVASGAGSVAHGYQASASGNYSMAVGENTSAAAQGSFVIGRYNVGGGSGAAWVATDPIFEIGIGTGTGINAADAMTVLKNGNVGIGVTSPAYKLDVNGDVNIAAANVLRFGTTQVCTSAGCTSSSDRRLKKNIKPLNNALNKVLKLEGVTYEWKDKNKYGHGQQVGLIAQDLEVVYPEVVVTDPKSGFKSVAYDHLIAPLIEAIKELNGQIKDLFKSSDDHSKAIAALKAEVEAKGHQVELLQAENATLKNRLEKIEKVLQAKGK